MLKFVNREGARGFGLVELVVTVAILGVLMLVAIPVFGAVQKNAITNVSKTNMEQLVQAIDIARAKANKPLKDITGSGCSRCLFGAEDPLKLPETHDGWKRYKTAIDNIGIAAGMKLPLLLDGYGRPFFIDENEGENGNCNRDVLGSFVNPYNGNGAIENRIDLYTFKC